MAWRNRRRRAHNTILLYLDDGTEVHLDTSTSTAKYWAQRYYSAGSQVTALPALIALTGKQYYVGASTAATVLANKLAPALLDRYLARTGYASQRTDADEPGTRETNLWHPADQAPERDYGAHGTFDERSHSRSAQAALARHPGLVLAAATGAVTMGVGAVIRRRGLR